MKELREKDPNEHVVAQSIAEASPPSATAASEKAEKYAKDNPLGGPAKMFEAIASRIRAGEDYYAVLDDYDLQHKSPPSASGRLDWIPDIVHRARFIVDAWRRGGAFSPFPPMEAIDFARVVVVLADRESSVSPAAAPWFDAGAVEMAAQVLEHIGGPSNEMVAGDLRAMLHRAASPRPQVGALDCNNCHACLKDKRDPISGLPATATRMILCPECGNKRCPKASDHNLACTGSNESGQPGSIYTKATPPTRETK